VKKFISIIFLFLSIPVYADWTNLSCINEKKDHSIKISFNEIKSIVNYNNPFDQSSTLKNNIPAVISENEIKFSINDNARKFSYHHTVDRNSGLMRVYATGNSATLSLIYQCSNLKQKF
jgi:hypothetical protein